MFCPNCGYEVPNNSKYCPNCGTTMANIVNSENETFSNINENDYKTENTPVKTFNMICCILYPVLILAIGLIAQNFTYISVILAIICGVSFYISGVYLLIIPLFIINLFKWGACDNGRPKAVKIIFGIIAFLCVIIGIIVPLSL